MSEKTITRKQLNDARHRKYEVIGYKEAFCFLNDCCEHCDKVIRFGCGVIKAIGRLQTKRILKICPDKPETEDKNK